MGPGVGMLYGAPHYLCVYVYAYDYAYAYAYVYVYVYVYAIAILCCVWVQITLRRGHSLGPQTPRAPGPVATPMSPPRQSTSRPQLPCYHITLINYSNDF